MRGDPHSGERYEKASDPDRQTRRRRDAELPSVLNQDAELFPEEFPEGPYGAPEQVTGLGREGADERLGPRG